VVSADDQSVTEMAIRSYPSPTPVQVYRWDLTTGKRTTVLTVDSPEKTWAAVFGTTSLSGDGSKLLVEAAGGHAIDVWDVSSGQKTTTLTLPGASAIVGDDMSTDGSVAGAGDADGNMYVWDTATQQLKGTFHYTYKAPVKDGIPTFPGLSPDGKQVIVYDKGAPITLWDIATGANITPHDARWAAQRGWQYSPDGRVLATEGEKSTGLELWDATTRTHVFNMAFAGGVRAWVYAISGDHKQVFTVGIDTKDNDTGLDYLWNLR
jgi:WD40 repeat protein